MSGIQTFLKMFDEAWGHDYESLRASLDGVSEAEAFRQAPAYRDEAPEAGWPPPGSIAWQVAHLAHCKRYYREVVDGRGQAERPPVPAWQPRETFAELRETLEAAHATQREAIAACRDDELDVDVGDGMDLATFLAMCIRHDTWHASQIAVQRRLHRHAGDDVPPE